MRVMTWFTMNVIFEQKWILNFKITCRPGDNWLCATVDAITIFICTHTVANWTKQNYAKNMIAISPLALAGSWKFFCVPTFRWVARYAHITLLFALHVCIWTPILLAQRTRCACLCEYKWSRTFPGASVVCGSQFMCWASYAKQARRCCYRSTISVCISRGNRNGKRSFFS